MITREKAEKLYKRVNTFFISCIDSEGYPLTKAMVPAKCRESLNEIFFCTNASSKFANEIIKNPKANVYFYSRKIIWFKGCFLQGNQYYEK